MEAEPSIRRPANEKDIQARLGVSYNCLSIMLLLWFSMIVAKCPCLQRIPSVARRNKIHLMCTV